MGAAAAISFHSTSTRAPSARRPSTCFMSSSGTAFLRSGTTSALSGTTFTFSDAIRAPERYHSGTTLRGPLKCNYINNNHLRFPRLRNSIQMRLRPHDQRPLHHRRRCHEPVHELALPQHLEL